VLLSGCAVRSVHDASYVSGALEKRTGHELRPAGERAGFELPAGVSLDDGLTEDEAVAIALWNNSQFQADAVALGFARADLIEAGLLRNPILSFLFPLGPKQLEATLNLPLEFFWQRPKRVAAAKLDVERVAEGLVQHGLNLTRDVLVSFADLALAREREAILAGQARFLGETATIAAARFRAGDISGLEETAFRTAAALAEEESLRATREAKVASEKLRSDLGLGLETTTFDLSPLPPAAGPELNPAGLLDAAFAARPDLRAAEIALEAAAERLGWERSKILNLSATLDANGEGKEGFEMGPGFVLELPVLNWNNGKKARAKAEMEQTALQYIAVRQRIAREVNEAHAGYVAARRTLEIAHSEILPEARVAAGRAENAYAVGEISYLDLLAFKRGLLDSELRAAEAEADMRRALAALQSSVGLRPDMIRLDADSTGGK
jgi:cobalt-zinc-cadmium efflux system outer membrane protein